MRNKNFMLQISVIKERGIFTASSFLLMNTIPLVLGGYRRLTADLCSNVQCHSFWFSELTLKIQIVFSLPHILAEKYHNNNCFGGCTWTTLGEDGCISIGCKLLFYICFGKIILYLIEVIWQKEVILKLACLIYLLTSWLAEKGVI